MASYEISERDQPITPMVDPVRSLPAGSASDVGLALVRRAGAGLHAYRRAPLAACLANPARQREHMTAGLVS
jgi:hypothetical protein